MNMFYDKYSSLMQHAHLNKTEILKWGRAYPLYFKDWMPENLNSKILDAGCGTGRFIKFLEYSGYTNIEGVDISEEQIQLAKKNGCIVYLHDIIEYLGKHSNTYDQIFAIDILEHIPKDNILVFINAIYNSLKPNGSLIIQTPNLESPWGGMIQFGDITHQTEFTPELLKKLLLFSNFKNVKYRPAGPRIYNFTSFIRVILWNTIKAFLMIWNLAERGDIGSGIYTRVFFINARKLVG
jgi:2-polyprenyl-3-methyl-5-hydroxy-6-metoxy-1,4-benzoquinol methylase